MKSSTVITSKELIPYAHAQSLLTHLEDESQIDHCRIKERGNYVLWMFHSEDDAARMARRFMELGFEYVQRVI